MYPAFSVFPLDFFGLEPSRAAFLDSAFAFAFVCFALLTLTCLHPGFDLRAAAFAGGAGVAKLSKRA